MNPIKTLARFILRREIADAEAIANPLLTGIHVGEGKIDIGLQGAGAQLIAGMFVGMLNDDRAMNFVEVTFDSQEHGPIIVTAQKGRGKSPATLLRECEEKGPMRRHA